MGTRRGDRWRWVLVFAVAAAVRLALWVSFAFVDADRSLEGDGAQYFALSRSLSTAYGGHRSDLSALALHRPPLYPVVVAAMLAVGRTLRWALFIQCFIGAGVAAVTYVLARRVTSGAAAIAAGLIVALDPLSVIHSDLLLTETLFAGLIAATAIFLLDTVRHPAVGRAVLAGGLLGLATLTRPMSLYLPLFVVPLLLWRARGVVKVRAVCSVALVLAFLIPVGGWAVRNRVVEGGLVVTTIDSYTMLQYRGRGALAAEIGAQRSRDRVNEIEAGYPPGLSAYERSKHEFSDGLKLMTDHPRGAIEEFVKGFVRTWTGPGTGQLGKLVPAADRPAVDVALFLPLATLLTVAAVGAGRLWAKDRDALVVFVCLLGYFALLSASTETYARFRVPMVPILAVLAAAGGEWFVARFRRPTATRVG